MKKISSLSFLLAALFAAAQTPNYVPSSGLVAWWGFNGMAMTQALTAIHLP